MEQSEFEKMNKQLDELGVQVKKSYDRAKKIFYGYSIFISVVLFAAWITYTWFVLTTKLNIPQPAQLIIQWALGLGAWCFLGDFVKTFQKDKQFENEMKQRDEESKKQREAITALMRKERQVAGKEVN